MVEFIDNNIKPNLKSVISSKLQDTPSLSKIPEWVVPSLDKLDVPELKHDLPRGYSGRFTDEAKEWWNTEY